MKQSVVDAFNAQIQKELHSAYVYMAMSAWLEAESYEGFASWMAVQAREEMEHAMRLYKHVLRRGGRVKFEALEAPQGDYDSPLAVFEEALAHERYITRSIHELFQVAADEGDLPAQRELDWFVDEQVEEEENAQRAVDLLRRAEGSEAALLMLEREFGERTDEDEDED